MAPINILDYGLCLSTLDQITNSVVFRHAENRKDLIPNEKNFKLIRDSIWNNFTISARIFGHGYGLNARFLKRIEFFKDYIYELKYEDALYKVISLIHNIMYDYVFYKEISNYLVAHKEIYKI